MLQRIVAWSLRYRVVVVALSLLWATYGLYVARHAKLDVFPEFAPPLVQVQTEAPGLSPEQVEELVTRPVENAVNGSGSIESIRSQSIQGLSVVTAVFTEGTDLLSARQVVAERLAEIASEMPDGIRAPSISPLTSATSTMLVVGLTSSIRSPMDLRSFADWTLRPRLLGVPGVAKINVFGGEVRQIQVQVEPERLAAHRLSLGDVLEAARGSTGVRGAGFLENDNQRIVVQPEAQFRTPEAIGATAVTQGPAGTVRLRDVARVVWAPEPKFGDARVRGVPGVVVIVSSQYGANTMEVTADTERVLAEMKPLFAAEGIELHERMFRPANFIETALRNVNISLALGGLLVAIVLVLFLLDLRAAFISFSAIPLSLLAAVIVLQWFEVSINTITLGGFAIAIGVVVDDAIIDVENIGRRLRENARESRPRQVHEVVLDASLEVRGAVVYATFIVGLVFVPVLTMSGVQGRLFSPLAMAFLLATLASLLVALTLTPALAAMLLPRATTREDPRYVAFAKDIHRALLATISRTPRLALTVVVAVFATALALIPFFGGEFLPEFREGHFIVHMTLRPGSSLAESMRLGTRLAKDLLADPHVRSVAQITGRSEQGDDTWGPNVSEFNVDLVPGTDGEEAQTAIRGILARYPGPTFEVLPFLTERIAETISGETAEVVVSIFGEDLDLLDRTAAKTALLLDSIRGAVDVQVGSPPGAPQVDVRLRASRLGLYGLRPSDVLDTLQAAVQGTIVAKTYEGSRVTGVAVTLVPEARSEPERLGAIVVTTARGVHVPLREIADIGVSDSRSLVFHDGARRRASVTCNVRGRDISSFVAEAKRRVAAEVALPPGLYVEFSGAAAAQAQARRDLLVHSLLAGAGIVLLLYVVLGNARNLLLVHANLPFALVGGVVAVFATGRLLSVGSLIGFVTLFGISTRNSIMLVSHYQHLVRSEGRPWNLATAIQGASERFVPVVMTALVTFLALLPVALSGGSAGHEIESPMAVVILGGLVTSTILNLLVLPTLALRYGRFEAETAPQPSPSP